MITVAGVVWSQEEIKIEKSINDKGRRVWKTIYKREIRRQKM